jgi:hypothetical protein
VLVRGCFAGHVSLLTLNLAPLKECLTFASG